MIEPHRVTASTDPRLPTPAREFKRQLISLACIALALATLPTELAAQETPDFFKQNCNSCHWIGGGRLIGPDLKGVSERKEREWLIQFILDPKAMIDAGDPYALQLQKEANGVIMLTVPGMTKQRAEALLDFIDEQSQLERSKFAGQNLALEPFSAEEITRGGRLFDGSEPLTNGGPACISCHTEHRAGTSLGGTLGPDLGGVLERLQGKNALSAWLTAPPTTTMKSVFAKHELTMDEIRSLVAVFEASSADTIPGQDNFILWMGVLFYGVGGTAVLMLFFNLFWSRRFRAVRRPLIDRANAKVRGES